MPFSTPLAFPIDPAQPWHRKRSVGSLYEYYDIMAPRLRSHIEQNQDGHLYIPQEKTGAQRIQKGCPMAAHCITVGG